MYKSNKLLEVFEVFQNHENYLKKIRTNNSTRLILNQILIICFFTLIYGLTMGSSHSILQAIISGVKLIVLFISTIIICLPSFYIIQLILGSKINLKQVMIIILSGFVMSSTVMVAFSPIIVFFLITGGDYYFMQLLHIAIFLFSGFFGIRFIIDALKFSCEKESLYPKIGVTVFKVWAVIFVFVGIQLAWNLRPFLGDRGEPFAMFRKYEGNFYTAVIYSIKQISLEDYEEQSINQVKESAITKKNIELIDLIEKQNIQDSIK